MSLFNRPEGRIVHDSIFIGGHNLHWQRESDSEALRDRERGSEEEYSLKFRLRPLHQSLRSRCYTSSVIV